MTKRDNDDFGSFRPSRDHGAAAGDGHQRALRPLAGERRKPSVAAPLRDGDVPALESTRAQRVEAPTAGRSPDDFIADGLEPTVARQPEVEPVDPLPRIARRGPGQPMAGQRANVLASPPYDARQPRHGQRQANGQRQAGDGRAYGRQDVGGRWSWPRRLAYAAVALLGIIGAAAAALLIYTPVDLVRDRLILEVKAKTGRDLKIGGRPSVSFWPRVAVSLGDVSLSNPPGLAGPPLLEMLRLDATIQLWPLLQQRVQVDQLVLQSPRITLTVDGQGRRNWDFAGLQPANHRRVQFAQAGRVDIDALPEDLRDFAKGAASYRRAVTASAESLSLGRIRIVDGVVRHVDERSRTATEVSKIDVILDAPDLTGPLQATGSLSWRGETVRLDTRLMPTRALLSGAPVQATAAVGSNLGQATFKGTVSLNKGRPDVDGQATVKAPSLARMAQWIGQPVAGEGVSGAVSFKGRVTLAGLRSSMTDAAIQLPGLSMSGTLAVDTSSARPKISGQMKIAELNVAQAATLRLLPSVALPVTQQKPVAATDQAKPQSIEDLLKAGAEPAQPQVRGFMRRDGWSEDRLDLSLLAMADSDLKIAFSRLSGGLDAGPGHVTVMLHDRVLKLTIDDATLHEGKLRGSLHVDGAAKRPAGSVNLTLDGVSMGPLLKAFDIEAIDGKGRMTLALTGSGHTERQVIDSLAGKAEVLVPRGAVLGYDVGQMVRGLPRGSLPSMERVAGARTDFTDLGASFTIAKGIADNRDFRIVTREARAIGNGQIALGARTIDAVLRPKLLGSGAASGGAGGVNLGALDLPIRITGSLDKPQVAADFSGVLRNPGEVVETLKQLDRNGEVQDTVKGLINGDEAAKKKARDFLNNLIKR